MKATRPEWRVSLKEGDTVSVDATYDVAKASWYESMGILPLAVSEADDPAAKDPWDDEAAVAEMYDDGGILTHGRLPENIDAGGRPRRRPRRPSQARQQGQGQGVRHRHRRLPVRARRLLGVRELPVIAHAPATRGTREGRCSSPISRRPRAWRTPTRSGTASPRARRRVTGAPGIGYPLANGPIKFDSGQLGYGHLFNSGVTAGTNKFKTPPLTKAGKTYTYFCRIHPFMRGSVRVKKPKNGKGGKLLRRAIIIAITLAVGLTVSNPLAAGRATKNVEVGDDFFAPDFLDDQGGQRVRFTWVGENEHNVFKETGPGPDFTSDNAEGAGFTYTRKFKKPGRYTLGCILHEEMDMFLRVKKRRN